MIWSSKTFIWVNQPALSGHNFKPDTCIEPHHLQSSKKTPEYKHDLIFKKPLKGFSNLDVLQISIMALNTKYNQSYHNLECSYQIKIVG